MMTFFKDPDPAAVEQWIELQMPAIDATYGNLYRYLRPYILTDLGEQVGEELLQQLAIAMPNFAELHRELFKKAMQKIEALVNIYQPAKENENESEKR